MFGWVNFFIFLFWSSILLFLFNVNFLFLLIYAEFTWLLLYSFGLIIGSLVDELTSLTFSFFILGFGGLEFAIGFMLVIFLKNLQITPINDTV